MRTLLVLLLSLPPSAYSQSQLDHYMNLFNQVTDTQKELKKLSEIGPDKCWDCGLKAKPVCSFADICTIVKSQSDKPRILDKGDGTYIPNYKLLGRNRMLNECRGNMAYKINYLPESAQKFAEMYKAKNRKLYEIVKENGDEKAFVAVGEAMLDLEQPNNSFDRAKAEKVLSEAEAMGKVKMSAPVREAWIDLASSTGGLWAMPEWIDDESLIDVKGLTIALPPTTVENVKAKQDQFIQQTERLEKVFEKVQKRMIAVLEKKTKPENATQMVALKRRISSIKMDALVDAKLCHSPNAFYNPKNHKFNICPQLAMLPERSILPIIAHELAHSIDPCVSTDELVEMKVNEPMPSFPQGPDAELLPYGTAVPFTYKVPDKDPKHIYANIKKEVLPAGATIHAAGLDPSQFPFNDTIKCLVGNDSVKARQGSAKNRIEDLSERLRDLEQSGGEDSETAKNYREQLAKMKSDEEKQKNQRCSDKGSQLQEAFSDWAASEVIAEDFPDDQNEAHKAMFETSGFFAALGCHKEVPQAEKDAFMACVNAMPGQMLFGGGMAISAHPFNSDRINKILMRHPKIKEALNCEDKGGKYCE